MVDLLGQSGKFRQPSQHIEAEFSAQLGESRDDQVVAHRKPCEQLVDLIAFGETELTHVGHAHAGDIATLEHDLAGRRRHFAGQHLEERRLAGAIGADNATQLAVVHGES